MCGLEQGAALAYQSLLLGPLAPVARLPVAAGPLRVPVVVLLRLTALLRLVRRLPPYGRYRENLGRDLAAGARLVCRARFPLN